MLRLLSVSLAIACASGSPKPGETSDTGAPPARLGASLGPLVPLSTPTGGLHHHATLAWSDDAFGVAWTTGFDPETGCWAQRFDADGTGAGQPVQLHDPATYCDKPDIAAASGGYTVAFDDRRGGIWLAGLAASGALSGAPALLHRDTIELDAVDLALDGDGAGIAIWTQSGAPWMGEDDGEIAWRAFDADRGATAPVRLAEQSSRKTSDAASLPGGGFAAVWARHHDHPVQLDEVLYEVHGRLYLPGGSTRSFRADDLDDAWPSRPAVAAHPADGRLAVSWRDKTASEGVPAGAYGRVLDPEGVAVGPSVALTPAGAGAGDGDRVVVAWAGSAAVFAWQETDDAGTPGIWLSALDGDTGTVVLDRLALSEPGGVRDERPSIAVRAVADGHEVMAVWETVQPGGAGGGLRARSVVLREARPPG